MTIDLVPFERQVVHARDVVVYKAIVRFSVEKSTLWLNPRFPPAERQRVLASALRLRFKGKWPPVLTGDADRDARILAYTRLAAGMSIWNRSGPDGSPAKLRESVYRKRPALRISDAGGYAPCEFSVAISEQGEHTLGVHWSSGRRLPGSEERGSGSGRSSLTDDLQKLVEADLLEKAALLIP
jgi:hypothetical protein